MQKNYLLFCFSFLVVFAGQTPVALNLMGWKFSNELVSAGMVFSIIAGVAAIYFFLSEAPNLGQEWVDKADLALKAAGALLAIVITFWFGLLQHQQEEDAKHKADELTKASLAKEKAVADKAAQDQSALAQKLEKERLRAAENAIRLRELLSKLASMDSYVRLQAVTNIGELISEQDAYDLTASQALFTASLYDADVKVKNAALKFLPVGIGNVSETTSFAAAVIEMTQKKTNVNWNQEHMLYLALVSIKDSASNPETQKTVSDLIAQLSDSKIKEASAAAAAVVAADTAAKPDAKTVADNTAKLDNLAPAIIYSLASSVGSDGSTAAEKTKQKEQIQQIQQAIQNTSPDAITSAIKNLPSDVAQQLSARVYLQIADDTQRPKAKLVQAALSSLHYICPGIQNVRNRAYIPDTLEVRYFVLESKGEAEKILQVIKANGAKDGRVSYCIPTANDLRISPDIKSHFEVWAGKSSF